ncbi:MAG: alpha/beta hydrolase [Betaproteobacteria bacterium]|nr:alpha/beta hydrolase [Betaproteobacteria bacterium]
MWQRLAPVLRKAGHEVLTPSLTGIGERAHLASPSVDLSTHIADVLGAIRYERLSECALVGHSYGGMVVTGVADRAPETIKTLVYLDAFVPQSGQALIDLLRPEVRAHFPKEAPSVAPLPPHVQGMKDPKEIAWVDGRRDPQPTKTFTQPLKLEGNYRGPRAYIYCTGYSPTSFTPFAERARNDRAWRYHELPTHHYPHISMPLETAGVLLDYP